ncbi:ribonuclease M5 [Mycoplasmoides gallisepticum]|uniref:ribonuclease M5 n=1 Tax=Mycoplasmoides gallisepticum TaxID=2096 RepID=UPI001246FD11|nr:ribonuclease M5 [Mycoplasmoides gallisepticum]QEX47499.1 ribonuclease M5 [Mycoplasmoides gallisepticum]ULH62114.1 ribonuclease M5 [Mycoplasmoides gallisepticum]ULH67456.1 ribonuclease M5 [Mycoplasmoides gallisepticum]ULH68182.1 ribonuclease M5 [Mycoplasmoides gallisepticum]WGG23780.1 ribonuclease M5 [Mycoplasmoides gallisepticum]
MSKIIKPKENSKRNRIKEIIVVEGKTDTVKLKSLFDCETIETNGSEISDQTISLIKELSLTRGVILFLDPDYQGKKIRAKLIKELKEYKEAFIDLSKLKHSKKKGIAEASNEAILSAFNNLLSSDHDSYQSLTWKEYLALHLNTKNKRLKLCKKLNIPYGNNKSLFRYLNLLKKNFDELKKLISEI